MTDFSTIASTATSYLALAISGTTAWLTLFRKGKLKMTRPTVVFFGPDDHNHPKVFLRTLLYSTAKRPHIVENMFIRLQADESSQSFNIWVYGETKALSRGSGLRVSEEGVVCNHHFLLPTGAAAFEFTPGEYSVEVYATLTNEKKSLLLSTIKLYVTPPESSAMKSAQAGLYFDWEPDLQRYQTHLDSRPSELASSPVPFVELTKGQLSLQNPHRD